MTAVSSPEDLTTEAIRRAISEASAGRLLEACNIGERALRDGGDAAALNAMLGMLRCRTGEFEAALSHLRPARDARPKDVSIASNFIMALVESGRHEEAFAAASPELAERDQSLTVARYRGYVAQLIGNSSAAAEAYEAIVLAAPEDWQSWNNLGNARLLSGDFDGAVTAFERSLQLNAEPILAWLNLARAHVKAGDLSKAEARFRATAEHFPNDAKPLVELHDLLRRSGRDEADLLPVLEELHRRDPGNRDVLLALARTRKAALDTTGAENAFRLMLQAQPSDEEAFRELARLYEHRRPADLEGLVAEAERVAVQPPTLNLVRAYAHRRAGRFAEGLAELEGVPAGFEPHIVEDLRGQFNDKLGRYAAAFAAFTTMNEAQAAAQSQLLNQAATHRAKVRADLGKLTPEWLGSWKAGPLPSDGEPPVFLVGFPRSGTTLLDTLLMGHPEVAVMEELPILYGVRRAIEGVDAIADLDEEQVLRLRNRYRNAAAQHVGGVEHRVLVDKHPLHMMQVPLIYRLFPDARFILAIRNPADVVLSCYFSNFRRTPPLANFLRLETAAEFYDLAFSTWERCQELLPIQVHTVIYEGLVENPEPQLRPIFEGLGLDWRGEILDHQSTAASRGVIPTASYAQVTQPLYRSSINRWERYRSHLEPILPTLQPWAEKFGYAL